LPYFGFAIVRFYMLSKNTEQLFSSQEYAVTNLCFPSSKKARSRKVISRSNARPTIKYPSWKNQRMIHCESMHELNACVLLDADVSVKEFNEQPCRIDYRTPNGKSIHYPDFLVARGAVKEFWEVKADIGLENEDIIFRESLLKELLPNLGYEYHLVCGKAMREGAGLENARFLVTNGRLELSIDAINTAFQLFSEFRIETWKEFHILGEISKDRPTLCRLILEGYVCFDCTSLISSSTKIWWNSERELAEV
jgi:hypothetical protein